MAIRSTVLPWTPEVASLAQPFYAAEAPEIPGVPIGINMKTRKVVNFDPWLLQSMSIINSCRGTVLGEKNHGKSTILKILMIRLASLGAGRETMRGLINNHKPEENEGEYTRLSEGFFESYEYRLATHKVNYIDQAMGLTPSDTLEAALAVAEFVGRDPLVGYLPFAMQLAVNTLIKMGAVHVTPMKLEAELFRLDKYHIDEFFETSNNLLMESVHVRQLEENELAAAGGYEPRDLIAETRLMLDRPTNLPLHEIQNAGAHCASLLAQTRGGAFGELFGDGESMSDVLTQDVVTLDWTGVPDRAKALLRTVLRIVRASSAARGDWRFIPHISLQDELSQSMEDPVFAKWAAFDSKIARALYELELSSTHRYDDFRKGGVGSQLYGYGQSVINDNSFTLLGRQADEESVLDEVQQRHHLSTTDRRWLTRNPRFCFGLCLGDQKMIPLRVFVTPMELEYIQTSGATNRMLDRLPVMQSPQVLDRLRRKNGVELVGVGDVS